MSDFHQTGVVATFHRLGKSNLEKIETELSWYCRERPVALVLPALYDDIEGEALKGIIRELREAHYLKEVVVSLGPASEEEFAHAGSFFSALPQRPRVIWNTGPRMEEVYRTIEANGIPIGSRGKGRDTWMACGYVLSSGEFDAIAFHDCDILTYRRDLLARLCYPVVAPDLGYGFCKGFYSRVTDRLHGRVTRLLFTPLIRALRMTIGSRRILRFFDSFRYPLAGEFSMAIELARVSRTAGDWGFEVCMLAEAYRSLSPGRVCQSDIADNYEHKHRELSAEDDAKGLSRMSIDVCKSVFRTLISQGVVFSGDIFNTLAATYSMVAQDMLVRYGNDAAINGLFFDMHRESVAVETFERGLRKASELVMGDPLGNPLIPSWERVISAVPGILGMIREAVEQDNADVAAALLETVP